MTWQKETGSGMGHKNTSSRGFTLIELLVAVAVIAILAGMLLPALNLAKETGRSAKCAGTVKQLVLALHGYANDWQDSLPPFYNADYTVFLYAELNSDKTYGTKGGLSDYLSNLKNARVCPSMPGITAENSVWNNSGSGGYGYNQFFLAGSDGMKPVRMVQIRRPVQTLAFADSIGFSAGKKIEAPILTPPSPGWTPSPDMHFRHNRHTSAAWADGHVSAERMTFTGSHYSGLSEAECAAENMGWFGPQDNTYFDLQ